MVYLDIIMQFFTVYTVDDQGELSREERGDAEKAIQALDGLDWRSRGVLRDGSNKGHGSVWVKTKHHPNVLYIKGSNWMFRCSRPHGQCTTSPKSHKVKDHEKERRRTLKLLWQQPFFAYSNVAH